MRASISKMVGAFLLLVHITFGHDDQKCLGVDDWVLGDTLK